MTWSATAPGRADSPVAATSKWSSSTVTPSALSPSINTNRTVVGSIDTPSTMSTTPPKTLLSLYRLATVATGQWPRVSPEPGQVNQLRTQNPTALDTSTVPACGQVRFA